MDKNILLNLINEFNNQMDEKRKEEEIFETKRRQFVKDYSINNIKKLTKEDYCLGLDKTTFCYRIENELQELGNIHGSDATKFGLYYEKWRKNNKKEYRAVAKYGTDSDAAMEKIKRAILKLLDNAKKDNEQGLEDSELSLIFRSKILATYYPQKYLNIYSEEHLNFFLERLGISDLQEMNFLEKQQALIKWKNDFSEMKSWSLLIFVRFLYEKIGQPKIISFKPDVEIGSTLSNDDLHAIFGVANMGGMRRSKKNNLLLIISDHTKSFYEDKWVGNTLYYTGMGKFGDQKLAGQNETLATSNENDTLVYLCEVLESGKYIYRGQVHLNGAPFQEFQNDSHGQLRKVWIFPLTVSSYAGLVDKEMLDRCKDEKNRFIKKMTESELKQKAIECSKIKVSYRYVRTISYIRDPYIAEYAKKRANGVCQLCGQKSPFNDKEGYPYLESHHIIWLSKGGDDSIENTVALCPNCHRKMHIVASKDDIKYLQEKNKDIKL